jgi:6-phosphogluconolactonase/glucosamine-6-phosphate isomerase/deaminase
LVLSRLAILLMNIVYNKKVGFKTNYKIYPDLLPSLALQRKESRNGILIINMDSAKQGSELARDLLYDMTNHDTVLFLSGGKTPVTLYSELGREQKLTIGAAAIVDERFGNPMHPDSNELMIEKTGLAEYFKKGNIPFYRILSEKQTIADTALRYDISVRYLISHFQKSVAILGIGQDGHIAGIAPNRPDFTNPLFSKEQGNLLVSYFIDPASGTGLGTHVLPHGFGSRVTMTIKGLSKMDALIILVFGEEKKVALTGLFKKGPRDKVPSRFIKDKTVAPKTILITDQRV